MPCLQTIELKIRELLLRYSRIPQRVHFDQTIAQNICRKIEKWAGPVGRRLILDFGCGAHYPNTWSLHNMGFNVVGVDIVEFQHSNAFRAVQRAVRAMQSHTESETPVHVVDQWLYTRIYHRIARHLGSNELNRPLMLVTYDGSHLPFSDASFDLFFSMDVFEHVQDVPQAIAELERVTKPGGVGLVEIHLFSSLSGAHNLLYSVNGSVSLPPRIEPWDHLRKQRVPVPPQAGLNRWRLAQFLAAFEARFEILDWERSEEGADLLTPEIRAELADYSEEELLTRTVTAVLRRQQ